MALCTSRSCYRKIPFPKAKLENRHPRARRQTPFTVRTQQALLSWGSHHSPVSAEPPVSARHPKTTTTYLEQMNGQLAPNMHNKSGLSLVLVSFHYQSDQRWHMPINCINVVTCLKRCSYMLGTVLSWFHSSFILVSSRYCSSGLHSPIMSEKEEGATQGPPWMPTASFQTLLWSSNSKFGGFQQPTYTHIQIQTRTQRHTYALGCQYFIMPSTAVLKVCITTILYKKNSLNFP